MIRKLQNINNWAVFYILVGITLLSLSFSALSHSVAGDVNWWSWADGAFQNFSTEMMGAIATFALFELVVGIRNEKKNLIINMRSSDNATVLNAVEQLRANGWLHDGSLREAKLWDANLQGANLEKANLEDTYLRGANLEGANLLHTNLSGANLLQASLKRAYFQHTNLSGADLSDTNLEGAVLFLANLSNANLVRAKFDEQTILPNTQLTLDGYDKYWNPETDMSRYTDPEHPDFWQPDWAKEQKD